MRNLAAKVPEDVWPDFKVRAQAAYQAPSRAIARELAAGVVADYGRKYNSAVACFMDDFEACIAHLRFPGRDRCSRPEFPHSVERAYLFVDGIAERLRPGAKREPVLPAWGFTIEGRRVLLHMMAGSKTVTAFFEDMKRRGLNDPLLVTSDGAPGIVKAIEWEREIGIEDDPPSYDHTIKPPEVERPSTSENVPSQKPFFERRLRRGEELIIKGRHRYL